ncbi:MAG TPA: hypothetical protein VKY19_22590 [Ktedonosporobacter sp.]|jgi:hypothetical protein|nr:hypothetical protein [Ktedonosporobacter sp.]
MELRLISPVVFQDTNLSLSGHGFSCFAAARYMAISTFGPAYPDLFFAYLYLYSHYDFLGIEAHHNALIRQPSNPDALERYVLRQKLGLELVELPIQDNLGEVIRQQLDMMLPVIVPIDRIRLDQIRLFISKNYRFDVEIYPLLIIGCDSNKRQFIIYDNVRNHQPSQPSSSKEQDAYAQFSIDEDVLLEVFQTTDMHYQFKKDTIHTIQVKEEPPPSKSEALHDIIAQIRAYHDHFPNLLQRKFAFLQGQSHYQSSERDVMIREEIKYINSQKILGDTLLRLLAEQNWSEATRKQVKKANIAAWQAWKKLHLGLSIMDSKGQRELSTLESLCSLVLRAEQNFLQLIAHLEEENLIHD